MGKREQAQTDAAFMRGNIGVDGAATDSDTRDEAEVEKDQAREQLMRGRTWLGREFLTWLLWRSESTEPVGEHDGENITALFVGRVVLRGLHGDVVELMAKGALAPYSAQVKRALDAGLLVHNARLRFTVGERTWECSLDAEFLDIKSAKLPELLTEEEDDRLTERLDLAEQLSKMVDALVEGFLAIRASRAWNKDVVPEMKGWMQGDGALATDAMARAQRERATA